MAEPVVPLSKYKKVAYALNGIFGSLAVYWVGLTVSMKERGCVRDPNFDANKISLIVLAGIFLILVGISIKYSLSAKRGKKILWALMPLLYFLFLAFFIASNNFDLLLRFITPVGAADFPC